MTVSVQDTISRKLSEAFQPAHLDVANESHMHNVPPGSESHFKVVLVSDAFEGRRLVQRHQAVNGVLKDELSSAIHALSMETLTPAEWQDRGGELRASPPCHGGSKADRAG